MVGVDTRCFLCRRVDDGNGINVTIEGRVSWICSYCEDRADDERGIDIPLDYTEDELENREGQPEFNGAFNAW